MKIFVTNLQGKTEEYEAIEGWSLMEILRDYGLSVKAECGGACSCATCHVYIDEKWISKLHPMRGDEEEMLDEAIDVKDNSRLSCQIVLSEDLDGLEITVAPNPD